MVHRVVDHRTPARRVQQIQVRPAEGGRDEGEPGADGGVGRVGPALGQLVGADPGPGLVERQGRGHRAHRLTEPLAPQQIRLVPGVGDQLDPHPPPGVGEERLVAVLEQAPDPATYGDGVGQQRLVNSTWWGPRVAAMSRARARIVASLSGEGAPVPYRLWQVNSRAAETNRSSSSRSRMSRSSARFAPVLPLPPRTPANGMKTSENVWRHRKSASCSRSARSGSSALVVAVAQPCRPGWCPGSERACRASPSSARGRSRKRCARAPAPRCRCARSPVHSAGCAEQATHRLTVVVNRGAGSAGTGSR